MSLIERLFGGHKNNIEPDIPFGRFSDAYKKESQYDFWDTSLRLFDEERYLEAFISFFNYLGDAEVRNVNLKEGKGHLEFEIYQGSKKVKGEATSERFKANVKVAKVNHLHLGFMRRLMEANYDLKYCRYALDDEDYICILFDTYTLDCSPYKLYYALKEIAITADKQDDLLIDEFDALEAVEINHTVAAPQKEKDVKYDFLQKQLASVIEEIKHGRLDIDKYPGGVAYLLLDLCYKLDYLVSPEGYLMEFLERIHKEYFHPDGKSMSRKIRVLIDEFEGLLKRSKQDFQKEIYRVKSTFGITTAVNHDHLVSFIDGELHNMDWYDQNGYSRVAQSIPGYIVGYCLFNYSLPRPDREFLDLYYRIIEEPFYNALGFDRQYFDSKKNQLNKRNIIRSIKSIEKKYRDSFPNLKPQVEHLNFKSKISFSRSFLQMLRDLDLLKLGQ